MARGFIVQPRSGAAIRALAHQTLDWLSFQGRRVPILHVIENVLPQVDDTFCFEILEPDEMERRYGFAAEGMTVHRENLIALRSDVYRGALDGNGRHRFTAAHELGHYFMHKDEGLSFPRRTGPDAKVYVDSEWQADCYARELLADLRFAGNFDAPYSLATHYQVSYQVAEIQWAAAKKMAH